MVRTTKWQKAVMLVLIAVLMFSLAACGGNNNDGSKNTANSGQTSNNGGNSNASGDENAPAEEPAEDIELTFFTNNSDRTAGQGKMEQILIDKYMEENPNVTIKVETLSPDPQFQDKIKVYNASNKLPDIITAWGNESYLAPLVNNKALAEFDPSELGDHKFVEGSLDGFTIDGKLYGLPRNSDFFTLFYNKQIFADNGIEVPATQADLLKAFETLKANDIIPIAMDGRDAWVSGIWFDTMVQRVSGTWDTSKQAMDRSGSYDVQAVKDAATNMMKWIDAGAFGEGFLNTDYGTARNLFGQGKAAMYMMGQWEMGMATDENFPAEVRDNIGAMAFPAIDGGKGQTSDLTAWFGGGYAVSNNSEHKEAAMDFAKWMFMPENWAKGVWENGITFPAQTYEAFITGNETPVQNDLSDLFNKAGSYSGTVSQDKFTPDTQKSYYDAIQKLEGGALSPEEFAKEIDQFADQSAQTKSAK